MNNHSNQQQGFTLVELMISILISTIMVGVAMSQLLGSRTLFALQEADSQIESNARYALEILSQNLRKSNYYDASIVGSAAEPTTGYFFARTCDANFNPCTGNGSGTDSDYFAVWYNPPSTDEVTCSGIALTTAAQMNATLANVFYIGADATSGVNGLRCRSYSVSGNTASLIAGSDQAIVEGIENMQVLYGGRGRDYIDSRPERYVSADTVDAIPNLPKKRVNWATVASVRITLLASTGFNDGASQAASKTYNVGDAPPITFSDGNRRKIFSSTVALNNAKL
jgi:type IV pilus assembly protein PilW